MQLSYVFIIFYGELIRIKQSKKNQSDIKNCGKGLKEELKSRFYNIIFMEQNIKTNMPNCNLALDNNNLDPILLEN